MNQSKNYLEVPPASQECSPVASVSERSPAASPPPHPWQPPPPLRPPRSSALRRGLSVQVWPGSGLCLVPCPGQPPAERRLSGGTAGPGPEASGCPRSRVACRRYSGLSRWTSLEEVREHRVRRREFSPEYRNAHNDLRLLEIMKLTAVDKTVLPLGPGALELNWEFLKTTIKQYFNEQKQIESRIFPEQSYRLLRKAPVLFCHLCIMTPRDIGAMWCLSPHENWQHGSDSDLNQLHGNLYNQLRTTSCRSCLPRLSWIIVSDNTACNNWCHSGPNEWAIKSWTIIFML